MKKRIVCYFLVFLITLYCFFIYDDKVLSTLLILEILYFCVSWIYLIGIKGKVEADMLSKSLIVEKNKEMPINVAVENKGKILPVQFKVILRAENVFTGEKITYKTHSTVDSQRKKNIVISLRIKECGNYKVILERIVISDQFFILERDIKVDDIAHICVLPEMHLIPIEICKRTREFITESDEYSQTERGEDSSEIYQVREYRKEDSVRDIHWKLSAKADEFMVKEYGKPLGAAVLVWLDLKTLNLTKNYKTKEKFTDIFEIVAAISVSLLEQECVHQVAWYETENKKISKKKISKVEHVYELLHSLLCTAGYEDINEVETLYEEAFKGCKFSTIIRLDTSKKLIVNGTEIDIPMDKGEIQWEQLYLQV